MSQKLRFLFLLFVGTNSLVYGQTQPLQPGVATPPSFFQEDPTLPPDEAEWERIKNSYELQDYEDYLFLYPEGAYSEVVRQRLQSLEEQAAQKEKEAQAAAATAPSSATEQIPPSKLCNFCGGWKETAGGTQFVLNLDGTAVFEETKQGVRCVTDYQSWKRERNELIFQKGLLRCENRQQLTIDELRFRYTLEGKNALTLKDTKQRTYTYEAALTVIPVTIPPIPLLCIFEYCVLKGIQGCVRWETKFKCTEYVLEASPCQTLLGPDWKPLNFPNPQIQPKTLAECRALCRTTTAKNRPGEHEILCLTP